jgi:hypothetical protein
MRLAVAILRLVLAATSVGFALNTKSRPAGDFVAVFVTFWLEAGIYTVYRNGDKKIMWTSGAMMVRMSSSFLSRS